MPAVTIDLGDDWKMSEVIVKTEFGEFGFYPPCRKINVWSNPGYDITIKYREKNKGAVRDFIDAMNLLEKL